MISRTSILIFDDGAGGIVKRMEPQEDTVPFTVQAYATEEIGHQEAQVPTPLEILRAAIISYGDLISPIDVEDWEASP